jgi:sterol desaturase/sphingolipid hydroxylase (fatty acid hydroxylase superfamily)
MSLLITYKAIIIVIWLVAIFISESVFKAANYPASWTPRQFYQRLARNFSLSLTNFILSPLIIIPMTVFLSGLLPSWRPEWMSHWGFIFVDLLILDIFLYGWHRANHRLPFLWRFHQVHHLDEFLDSTTALRFHFGEVFLSAVVRVIFISLLAIPITTVIIVEIVLMICTIFHHSNLRVPPKIDRILRHIFVTPSIHWVHHHPRKRDTDSNYAAIFSWWDRWFRSRNTRLRWKNMSIGVEGCKEQTLWKLLTLPVQKGKP